MHFHKRGGGSIADPFPVRGTKTRSEEEILGASGTKTRSEEGILGTPGAKTRSEEGILEVRKH